MIIKLHRNELDIAKYDTCVRNSTEYRMYALSWYLDIVADTWGVLILGDYEAVMPLPFMKSKRYFYRKKIIQPFFCQQLGVFATSKKENAVSLLYDEFLAYNPVVYNFNSENLLDENRVNYELSLSTSYDNLKLNYNKRRRRSVGQAKKNELNIVLGDSPTSLVKIASKYYKVDVYTSSYLKKMQLLVATVLSKEKGLLLYVEKDGVLLGGGFFLKDQTRIINLFTAFSNTGKKNQAPSFLMNYIIEEYSNTDLVFDFEGSMIPSIASFFKSFGATENNYYQYSK